MLTMISCTDIREFDIREEEIFIKDIMEEFKRIMFNGMGEVVKILSYDL